MHICFECGFKYLVPIYEGELHIYYRCPKCNKIEMKRKQIEFRGKIIKPDGREIVVNIYDGEIKKIVKD